MLEFDYFITNTIRLFFPHNALFDTIFSFFSGLGYSIPLWIIILLFFIMFEEKKHRFFFYSFFISVIGSFGISQYILKFIFKRVRPEDIYHFCTTDFSFPSGHSTVAFAGASIIAYYDPKRKYLYYLFALCVAISRIYLSCHYVSDTIAGAIIGYLITQLTLYFVEKKR
ncbi:MAG: phosphatase PAP2 family protein [Candidatus Roizmanbacteria bacterium]